MMENASIFEQAKRFVPGPAWEMFFLERAEGEAKRLTSDQHRTVQALFFAADRRLRAAELLSSDEDVAPAALLLAGEGMKLMMAAVLAARGVELKLDSLSFSDLAGQLRALSEEGKLPSPLPELEIVRDVLTSTDPLAYDKIDSAVAATQRMAIDRYTRWMRRQIEVRTPDAIRTQRRVRLSALVAALVLLVGFGLYRAIAPSNVAYHKPVTMSSREPNQPPGAGPEGAAPAGIVDGSTSAVFDVVTRGEVRPWVQIDLEKSYKISKIVVYDRSDCCWDSQLPAVVEVSKDGQTYREVGRRATPFLPTEPWTISVDKVPGRYVRMRRDSNDVGNIVLREIEVYGS